MDNITLIDKPKGITSFDVIRKLKVIYRKGKRGHDIPTFDHALRRGPGHALQHDSGCSDSESRQARMGQARLKMGHAGTLDPLASGLLIIGIGKGTKKLNQFLKLPKIYDVVVLLGEQRSTGDMEGKVTHSKKVEGLNIKEVKTVLDEMVGNRELAVPKYSAVKVDGERLYKKAREGADFEPPKKIMEIMALKLNGGRQDGYCYRLDITMKVGSGAYVRSIAEELGRRLDYPATVKELRRISIGDFCVGDAEKL